MDLSVYTDGSWSSSDKSYTYGGIVIVNKNSEVVCLQRYKTGLSVFVSGRNHGGELVAAMMGIAKCISLLQGESGTINIYYDYKGVEAFVDEWVPKSTWKDSSIYYHNFVTGVRKDHPDNPIVFHKVAAHTGVKWNEVADSIANGHIPAYLQDKALPMLEV